jgi:hypothetical protein
MTGKLSCIGSWFMPQNPEKKLWGTLEFIGGDSIQMVISGKFDKVEGLTSEDTIFLGDTNEGILTILGCYLFQQTVQGTCHFRVRYLFRGVHIHKREDISFRSIKAKLNTLNEWSYNNGFDIGFESVEQGYSINYKTPNKIPFEINEKIEASLSFFSSIPNHNVNKKINLRQDTFINIKVKDQNEKIDFEKLLEYLTIFQNFITFGTYKNSFPLSILFYEKHNVDFYAIYDDRLNSQPRHNADFLYSYKDIKDEFNTVINKWFSNYENLRPIIILFIDAIHEQNIFSENKFLNITQALETFHRRRRKNILRFDKEYFKTMCEEVLDSVPEKYKDIIKEKANFANEPTLQIRLELLISEFKTETFNRYVTDEAEFIKQTKDSRNYYTHYDSKGEKKAKRDNELFVLTERLKMLLYSALLIESGFSRILTAKILTHNRNNFFMVRDSIQK